MGNWQALEFAMRDLIVGIIFVFSLVACTTFVGCTAQSEPLKIIEPTFSYARDGNAAEFAAGLTPDIEPGIATDIAPVPTLATGSTSSSTLESFNPTD